jgi:hypothetical protein
MSTTVTREELPSTSVSKEGVDTSGRSSSPNGQLLAPADGGSPATGSRPVFGEGTRDGAKGPGRRPLLPRSEAQCGTRTAGRRHEALYDVPGFSMKLRYDITDPRKGRAIGRVIASMLRVATRDYRSVFATDLAVTTGRYRNLWARRRKAWVTSDQLEELNRLVRCIDEILGNSEAGEGKRLIAHTLVVAGVESASPQAHAIRC